MKQSMKICVLVSAAVYTGSASRLARSNHTSTDDDCVIEGSENWWFCWHGNMAGCGTPGWFFGYPHSHCCCDGGFGWVARTEQCVAGVPQCPSSDTDDRAGTKMKTEEHASTDHDHNLEVKESGLRGEAALKKDSEASQKKEAAQKAAAKGDAEKEAKGNVDQEKKASVDKEEKDAESNREVVRKAEAKKEAEAKAKAKKEAAEKAGATAAGNGDKVQEETAEKKDADEKAAAGPKGGGGAGTAKPAPAKPAPKDGEPAPKGKPAPKVDVTEVLASENKEKESPKKPVEKEPPVPVKITKAEHAASLP